MKQRNFVEGAGVILLVTLALVFGGTVNANALTASAPVAYGTVGDGPGYGGARDGVPDSVRPDFFAVLNREPPDQEERGIAEFDISQLQFAQASAIFSGELAFNTTGPETLELWGYSGDGTVTLSDFDAGNYLIATFEHIEGPLSIDVLAFLNERIDAGDTYVGFAIRQPAQRAGRKVWRSLQLVTTSPADLVEDLAQAVTDLDLDKGVENSLNAKLDAAYKKLTDDNDKNDVAAVNQLEAFINEVEAQRGKKIPEADADALIALAQEIIEILEAG